jgi:hypothetical protein
MSLLRSIKASEPISNTQEHKQTFAFRALSSSSTETRWTRIWMVRVRHNERKRQNPQRYVFRCALCRGMRPSSNGDNYDILEFLRCDACFCRGVCSSTGICLLCGFCFCSDANHALNGVNEENRDEYEADLKTIGDFPDNIGLWWMSAILRVI